MNTKKFTQKIDKALYQSNEFWTATNKDYLFEFLPDNVIAINGEEEDGQFFITVHKITDSLIKKSKKKTQALV